jgi:hypothetical protein
VNKKCLRDRETLSFSAAKIPLAPTPTPLSKAGH